MRFWKDIKSILGPLSLSLALVFFLAPRPLEEARQVDGPAEIEMTKPPLIALTFDDGPDRATTTQLLDGLAQRGVQATFFTVGEMIPGKEDIIQRMAAEGHQIGIHTYDHVRLTGLNTADFQAQVGRTGELLEELTGRENFCIRPPYGMVDAGVERKAPSALILWSVDPEDWKYKDAARVTAHVVSHAADGDIILLHDIYPTSVEAALDIVDTLHQKGFLFVTVEELARERHVALEPGQVYREFHP